MTAPARWCDRLDPPVAQRAQRAGPGIGARLLSDLVRELVTELPRIEDGYAYPMTGPGLGTRLLPDVFKRPDVTVERTDIKDL